MLVFLDFEASSLGKHSYPIEVAWVFEDGRYETHLIKPADGWTDWDVRAQAIHRISPEIIARDGAPHDAVARRMLDVLAGHDLLASAPSWDGKWLSILLRAAGLPRHALRLRDSDDAHRECAEAILRPIISADQLSGTVADLMASTEVRSPDQPPAHRALADAQEEYVRWQKIRTAAEALISALQCRTD